MCKKSVVFLFAILFGIFLHSNAFAQWVMSVDGGILQSIQPTPDGGFIGAGDCDYWVVKLRHDKTIEWEKTYGGVGQDYANSIAVTTDGSYIVGGVTKSFGVGNADIWVLKINANGTIAWQNTYGSASDDIPYTIRQTSNGGYILSSKSNDSFNLTRLNGDGSVAWSNSYGPGSGISIQETQDSGFIAAGYTSSGSSIDALILKIDSSGSVIWQRTYGGTGEDIGFSVAETSDGGYIFSGKTTSFGSGGEDLWVVKLDFGGNIVWENIYGGSGNEGALKIFQTLDGEYLAAGYTNSFGNGDYDFWIIKLDSSGSIIKQTAYGTAAYEGPGTFDFVSMTPEGEFLATGRTGDDSWIMMLNSDGEIPGSPYIQSTNALQNITSSIIVDNPQVAPLNLIIQQTNVTPANIDVYINPSYKPTVLGNTTISTDTTWTAENSPYLINGNITIENGATLTIEPGTIIKIGSYSGIWVASGGTLNAIGTADQPIIFTAYTDDSVGGDTNGDGNATSPGPGAWNMMEIFDGGNAIMRYCEIRYGGGPYGYALSKSGAGTFALENSIVSYNNGYGLMLSRTTAVSLAGTTFIGNTAGPVALDASASGTVIPDTYTGTLYLTGGTITTDTTWGNNQVYVIPGAGIDVASGATLTIEPGTIIKIGSYSGISVASGGTLNAIGTADQPIIFTSSTDDSVGGDTNGDGNATSPGPGAWNMMEIFDGGNAIMRYCEIRYGGAPYGRVLYKAGTGIFALENSIVSYNNGYGLMLSRTTAVSLAGTTFIGNTAGPVALDASASGTVIPDTYTGTLYLTGGTITTDTTWGNNQVYVIPGAGIDVAFGATLTIEPGTIIKIGSYSGIWVASGGTLNAIGTADQPIIFTAYTDDSVGGDTNGDGNATSPGPWGWNAIIVYDGGNAILRYCEIRYGGGPYGYALSKSGAGSFILENSLITLNAGNGVLIENTTGPVTIANNTIKSNTGNGIQCNNSSPTIENNIFKRNKQCGIYANGASTSPQIIKNEINSNNIGVCSTSGAHPVIGGSLDNGNDIYGNKTFGVQNTDSLITVNAQYNYWGSATGPNHPVSNPAGTGDKVSDYVNFGNYSETSVLPISAVNVSSLSGDSVEITWHTKEPSDSQIEYRLGGSSEWIVVPVDPAMVNSHSMTLTGMIKDADYCLHAKSTDALGNVITSPDYCFTAKELPEILLNETKTIVVNSAPIIYKINVNQPGTLFIKVQKREYSWLSTVSIKLGGQPIKSESTAGDSLIQINVQPGEYIFEIEGAGTAMVWAGMNLPSVKIKELFVGTIYHNDGYDWAQMDVPENTGVLEFTVETLGNISTLDVWRGSIGSNEHWQATQFFNPPVRLRIENVTPGRYYLRVYDHGVISGGTQVRDYSIMVNAFEGLVTIDNDTVHIVVDKDAATVQNLVFKKGSNSELIPQSQAKLFGFGNDARLGNYLKTDWKTQWSDIQPSYVRLLLAHPSGFKKDFLFSWSETNVDLRVDLNAPEPVEMFNVLAPGGYAEGGRDRYAFVTDAGLQTGMFSYPGTHTPIYPSDHSWGTLAENWTALWDDGVDEVYGYTFSNGIQTTTCNDTAADQHFLIPAGESSMTFRIVKPKTMNPYEAISAFLNKPDFSIYLSENSALVGPGAENTYCLNYKNTGAADATGLVLDMTVSPYLDVVQSSIQNGGVYNPTTRHITWNLPFLAKGEVGSQCFQAIVNQAATYGTTITNSAVITSNEVTTPITDSETILVALPEITSVSPTKVGNNGSVTITIIGKNLDPMAEVKLTKFGEADIISLSPPTSDGSPVFPSPPPPTGTSLTRTFDLTGKTPGNWTLVVTYPGGEVTTLTDAITIEQGGEGKLWVDIVGPSQVRSGRTGTFTISYGNSGSTEIQSGMIEIKATNATLDTESPYISSVRPGPFSSSGLVFFIYHVGQDDFGSIPLKINPIGTQDVNVEIRAFNPDEIDIINSITSNEFSSILGQPEINIEIESILEPGVVEEPYTPWNGSILINSSSTSHECTYLEFEGERFVVENIKTLDKKYTTDYEKTFGHKLKILGVEYPNGYPESGSRLTRWDDYWKRMKDEGAIVIQDPINYTSDQLKKLADTAIKTTWPKGNAIPYIIPWSKCTEFDYNLHYFANGYKITEKPPNPFTLPIETLWERHKNYGSCPSDNSYCGFLSGLPWFSSNVLWGLMHEIFGDDPSFDTIIRAITLFKRIFVRFSYDPNDKFGPTGYDPEGTPPEQKKSWVPIDHPLPYMVSFENLETATAAVQDMKVTDQLDVNLDWATFSFDTIQIGAHTISIPQGSQSVTTTVDFRPEMEAVVDVSATYDPTTGKAEWLFRGKNPYTGELADFLPPNTLMVDPKGKGFVSYSIKPKQDLPTGTVIRNKATVDFEVDVPPPPMDTPEVFNTIDSVAPQSQVAALSSTQTTLQFPVSWNGSDDPGGSGIKNYDIYVSDNGGLYTLWISASETSATFTGQYGHQYSFYGRARDNVGNIEEPNPAGAVTTFIIVPNYPPVITPIGNQTITEGQQIEFTVNATDENGNELTYSVSGLPEGATFDPVTRTFSWTPGYYDAGTYEVTFTVTDNGPDPLTTSETITITVGNVNQPPILDSIGNKTINESQSLTFTITATDPDGNGLTYSIGNLPEGASFDPATQMFSWTPTFNQAGNYTDILFKVTDDDPNNPLTATESITITVNNVNRPPDFTPIGDKTVLEDQLLQFTVTATDPDLNGLTYSANNLPAGAQFDPATQTFTWTPGFDQAGNYPDIEFTVVDDGSPMEVAVQLITITVGNVNRAPVFIPVGTQQVLENQLLQFTVSAVDYDGDSISYSTGSLPTGVNFDSNTKQFIWTPDQTQAGTYVVDFNATYNYIEPATGTISVVIAVGDVPTPCEMANNLINTVIGLNLEKAVENSYMANLKKVCQFVEEGKITPAINQLNAFINKVENDIDQGKIGSTDGNNLINMANALIAKLQG